QAVSQIVLGRARLQPCRPEPIATRALAPVNPATRGYSERPAPSRDAAGGPYTCSRAAVRRGHSDPGPQSYPPFRRPRESGDRKAAPPKVSAELRFSAAHPETDGR